MAESTARPSILAGVVVLRCRRETRDRLFGGFALAFWMLAINDFLLALFDTVDETRTMFLPRLSGFLIVLVTIVDHNRR